MAEIVYVLTNESMEGMVKIGRTSTSVEQRIRELDNTSLPLPFQCFYAAEVSNAATVEGKLHRIFSDKRVRANREFFRVDPNQVREAIQEETMSPSAAALKAVRRLGYDWAAISGSDYWQYDGETLTARRLRLEDEQ